MDIKNKQNKIIDWLKRYRYILLVLVIGLVLMLIPSFQSSGGTPMNEQAVEQETHMDLCTEIESLLSQIEGAGDVRVMLTVKKGEEIIYQTDEDKTASDSSNVTKMDTITITFLECYKNGHDYYNRCKSKPGWIDQTN